MEQWRRLKEFPDYLFSDRGRMMNIGSGKQQPYILAGTINKGYLRVKINHKVYSLHRLIAKAFIPNPFNYESIDHIDGNKTNNCVNNLEWVTHEENVKRHFENVFTIANTQTGQEWICRTQGEASKVTGLSQAYISLLYHGKRPKSKWKILSCEKKFWK